MFIYVIVCRETLKCYVGQHKKTDLGKYLSQKYHDANRYSGKRSHLYAAMRLHPRETWSIHPLVSGVESRQELDELEKHFIRVLKTQHPDVGYNICDGGEGFTGPHTLEARKKMGRASRGNQNCKGLKNALGCKHSLESLQNAHLHYADRDLWKLHQSAAQKLEGKHLFWKGKKFSDTHRENLQKSHKGIPWSAARRAAQKKRSTK